MKGKITIGTKLTFQQWIEKKRPNINITRAVKDYVVKTNFKLGEDLLIANYIEIDKVAYTKSFKVALNPYLILAEEGTKTALRLFIFIEQNMLIKNKDVFMMNYEIYYAKVNTTRQKPLTASEYSKALTTLKELNIVKEETNFEDEVIKNYYYINSDMIFYGCRLKLTAHLLRQYNREINNNY